MAYVAGRGTGVDLSAAGTTNMTLVGAVAAGNKIIVAVAWQSGTATLSSVAGGGLTWTIDAQVDRASAGCAIVSADAPTGLASGTVITLTWSGAGDNRRCWAIREHSGLKVGAPAATRTATATSASTSSPSAGPPTTNALSGDDAVVAVAFNANVQGFTTGAGFGSDPSFAVVAGSSTQESLVIESGSQNAGAITGTLTVTNPAGPSAAAAAIVIYPKVGIATPQTTGTPALNAPPPDDLQSQADQAQATDNYDVVINGTGFILFRGDDDSPPTEHFKTEPIDMTFAPVFIDRANVQGDLGDNVQDFYMSFVQRDWSKGIGQKYFRQQVDRDSSFYEGMAINPTKVPGAVTPGVDDVNTFVGVTGINFCYFKETGILTTSPGDAMVQVVAPGGVTVVLKYWTADTMALVTQPTSGGTIWTDCCDLVAADNGTLYCLEGGNANTSTVHSITGLSSVTVAWTNWTAFNFTATCIEFFNNQVYVGGKDGTLRQVTSAGGAGVKIKDFGGGHIVDITQGGGFLWVLYCASIGDYRLYSYDGTTVIEVARLPRGWRYQPFAERSVAGLENPVGAVVSAPGMIGCVAYSEGVVYVSGLTPARDNVQSKRGAVPFRTALWFYAAGNNGLIWQAEETVEHYMRGGGGACCVGEGGIVFFMDTLNYRLMAYDPGTGGVYPVARQTFGAPAANSTGITTTVSGAGAATTTARTVTVTNTANFFPGGIITSSGGGSEKALILSVTSASVCVVLRGVMGTTVSASTFANGATLTVRGPFQPIRRLEYDFTNHIIVGSNSMGGPVANGYEAGGGGNPSFGGVAWLLRYGTDWTANSNLRMSGLSYVITSSFDFNSSLTKYFRSVAVDGDTTQLRSGDDGGATTVPGTFDIYYRLNGVSANTLDYTLLQASAVPGTNYSINLQGQSISIMVVLNAPAGTTQYNSLGPVLRRISVRGAPIMPGYRMRRYAIAMFDDLPLKGSDYLREPNTPAQLRAQLEAMVQSNVPVLVSDGSFTNVSMMFQPDQCKFREIRPREWVGYVQLREV